MWVSERQHKSGRLEKGKKVAASEVHDESREESDSGKWKVNKANMASKGARQCTASSDERPEVPSLGFQLIISHRYYSVPFFVINRHHQHHHRLPNSLLPS